MLPFVKSSLIVTREQEERRDEQLTTIERSSNLDENTLCINDGTKISLASNLLEEQTGLVSRNVAKKIASKLSPQLARSRTDLIHPSLLSRKNKSRKERRRKTPGFNIDEHLAQLKRKQTGVGRNLPSARISFPESVTVKRENMMVTPTETSRGNVWGSKIHSTRALLNETTDVYYNKPDVKFDLTDDVDDISSPFLKKPRMMYPIELKDKNLKENTYANMVIENLIANNSALKFGIEE